MQRPRFAAVPVVGVGGVVAIVLLTVAPRHGYHRDELYFRVAGQHLAWGYVDQPPLTPAFARLGIALFGDTPFGLRVIPAAIAACTVITAAALARELRSDAVGQTLAALATAVTAMVLQSGHMLSTPTTDVLLWLVIAAVLTRMLADAQPRWWVPLGAIVGVAMLNKDTVAALVVCLGVGLAAVGPRTVLHSRWLPVGVALAIVVCAPNLIWQWRNGFPMLSVAAGIGGGDPVTDRVLFVPMQILLVGPPLAPVAIAGLIRLWRDPAVAYARSLAVAYPVAVLTFLAVGGKFYYVFGLLAVLVAAGAAPTIDWARTRLRAAVVVAAVALTGVVDALVMLPLVPARSGVAFGIVDALNSEQGEQVGWPALVSTVDGAWRRLPASERDRATIITTNYGEAGAIDRLGPRSGLPQAYSGHMSFYDWGPPPDRQTGPVVLVTTRHRFALATTFTACRPVATIDNGVGVDNDEQGGHVWVCEAPTEPWSRFWPRMRRLS